MTEIAYLVLLEDLADLLGLAVSEHETNVKLDSISKLVEGRLRARGTTDHELLSSSRVFRSLQTEHRNIAVSAC